MDDETLFRGLLLIGLLVLVVPLLMMSFMMLMMGGMMGGVMGGMSNVTFFGFIPLLLVLVVVYAGYRLAQTDEESDGTVADGEATPIEQLQEQYVEGEITETEFERRLEQHYGSTDGSESTNGSSVETAKRRQSKSER